MEQHLRFQGSAPDKLKSATNWTNWQLQVKSWIGTAGPNIVGRDGKFCDQHGMTIYNLIVTIIDPELFSLVHGILESCYAEQDAIIGDSADAKAARLAVNPANRLWSKLESHFVGILKSKSPSNLGYQALLAAAKAGNLSEDTYLALMLSKFHMEVHGEAKTCGIEFDKKIKLFSEIYKITPVMIERIKNRAADVMGVACYYICRREQDIAFKQVYGNLGNR